MGTVESSPNLDKHRGSHMTLARRVDDFQQQPALCWDADWQNLGHCRRQTNTIFFPHTHFTPRVIFQHACEGYILPSVLVWNAGSSSGAWRVISASTRSCWLSFDCLCKVNFHLAIQRTPPVTRLTGTLASDRQMVHFDYLLCLFINFFSARLFYSVLMVTPDNFCWNMC